MKNASSYLLNKSRFIQIDKGLKIYRGEAQEHIALKDIDLCIEKGQFVAIVGESGSGKSTLLNVLSGIDHLTAGQIRIGKQGLGTMKQEQLSRWRGINVGIVFQFFQLIPTLSVVENVMLPMDFCNTYAPAKRKDIAKGLLDRLGILQQADKLPSALSGGQQQRTAIARALANDPPIVMADEPTGNLDSKTSELIISFFEQLVREGKTLILVTHSELLAERAEKVVTLKDGKIVEQKVTKKAERHSRGEEYVINS